MRERSKIDFDGIAKHPDVQRLIALALDEDLADAGDVTSISLVDAESADEGWIVAREPMVLAGLPIAVEVFRVISDELDVECFKHDGDRVDARTRLMRIKGPARAILSGERLALNFLQRLCGVATVTREFVAKVEGHKTQLLDTRKTTPGFRILEKYAVFCGGGSNHRCGLYDQVLIKDNHLSYWADENGGGLQEAVLAARKKYPELLVEIEADTVTQVREVLPAQPDVILLDNMTLDDLRICVKLCKGVCQTEASGGVNLDTITDIAATGVDAISVGGLTHSAPSMDLAMDF